MAQLALTHIKGNTYFIPAPVNIGVYIKDNTAILIDSGNDKEAGRQILRLLNQQGLNLKLIINTHSHADHIGGNAFLQEKTGCAIAATLSEAAFINNPLLEPALLYGGFPHRDLRNKFLLAKPSLISNIIDPAGQILDTRLKAVSLPGHSFEMIGVITPDEVCFIADSLFPENIINKYHLFYLWDIRSHLDTLENIAAINSELYIPSHGEPLSQLNSLVESNKGKIHEILAEIKRICIEPLATEEVLQKICAIYGISLNATQYVLLSSTIRSFLAYLFEEGLLEYVFTDSGMVWQRKT